MRYLSLIMLTAYLLQPVTLSAQGVSFSRLFSTPAQRAELDASRERLMQGLEIEVVEEETPEIEQERFSNATTLQELLLPRAKFNGVIIRQDGSADYWVNGRSTRDSGDLGQEIRNSTHNHGARLTIDFTEGQRVNLDPGQVFSFENDRMFEGYQDPHRDEGVLLAQPTPVAINAEEDEILDTAVPNDAEGIARPSEVFDESFLIQEIQKIQLLEQRLSELETGVQQPSDQEE